MSSNTSPIALNKSPTALLNKSSCNAFIVINRPAKNNVTPPSNALRPENVLLTELSPKSLPDTGSFPSHSAIYLALSCASAI